MRTSSGRSRLKRLISVTLCVVMYLSIITATPFNTFADSTNVFTGCNCGVGGTIAEPTGQGLTSAHILNGNALRPNSSNVNVAVLEFNVLNLIAGTNIKANEIYGIEALIWAPQANTRQIYIEVNGVQSPMFETNTTNPNRIHLPREAVHPLTYQLDTPFVSSANPSTFNVRVRSSNAVWGIGPITLLNVDGEALGTTTYSTLDSNGTWSSFAPVCRCLPCGGCGDLLSQGGTIVAPSKDNALTWDDRNPPAHVTNGNNHRMSGVHGTAQAVLRPHCGD